MYRVSSSREFPAFHYLTGGDWGAENENHPHDYRVEVTLEGPALDAHGYLADLVTVEKGLDQTVETFRKKILNSEPEFKGLNPSLEHFCRIFWVRLTAAVPLSGLFPVTVKIWENERNWASFTRPPRS